MSSKISCQSLEPADKEGYLTKQGGSYKSWKRRWFVLKDTNLYYFKTKKDPDCTGVISITKESFIQRDTNSKKKGCFAVGTAKRVFFMYPDADDLGVAEEWIKAISNVISSLNDTVKAEQISHPQNIQAESTTALTTSQVLATSSSGTRAELRLAKECIPFLSTECQASEFWNTWMDSLPTKTELTKGALLFELTTSVSMEKITWRSSGHQSIVIQKMIDFFWSVGAPEQEIDRLGDLGAAINPEIIGTWLDMSDKGGMDGGWYFPVDLPMKKALDACDEGSAVTQLMRWTQKNSITQCYYLSRDMGSVPPRQTEIKFQLSGNLEHQINTIRSAYSEFEIEPLPERAIQCLQENLTTETLCMAVTTSAEGFVKLNVVVPRPKHALLSSLCQLRSADLGKIERLQKALSRESPAFLELQQLVPGFGYDVYKEGFDVTLHYCAGEERCN